MSYVAIKLVPKPNSDTTQVLDPNSNWNQNVRRETALALSASELYMTLKAAYDHARLNPELYMDDNGSISLPWGTAARALFERIETGWTDQNANV